eukprot:scaffold11693_cov154-Amphora_coffeaeformis.AAC.1
MPKRPRTAYNLFFRDQQEKIAIMKQRDPTSANSAAAVSEYWKELTPNEKAIYFQMAADDKFRYYKEKSQYSQAMTDHIEMEMHNNNSEEMKRKANANFDSKESNTGVPSSTTGNREASDDVPFYSRESIAFLASKLDAKSIDFLIRAFK